MKTQKTALLYAEAAYFLNKAYLIYPSTNIHFLTNYALINTLAKAENDKNFNPETLAQFVNLNQTGSDFSKGALEHFALVCNELMVVHPNPKAFHDYYTNFTQAVDSTVDLNSYEFEYKSHSAYHFYINRNYPEALNALRVAYQINTENLQMKEFICNTCADHMMNDRNHEANIDSLQKYFAIFPFLKEDNKVMSYYNYAQMRVIRESFNYGNIKKGLPLLDEFEQTTQNTLNPSDIDQNYFAEIYLDLSNHYLRKENLNKATQALKRGIRILPNSSLLKDRYQTLAQINAQFNQQRAAFNTTFQKMEESYKEKFDRYFISCWTIDGSLTRDNKEGNYDETFQIMSYDDNEVNYVMNGKTKKGKYSLREKSKLLYLIPNADEDDYTIFKLIEVNKTEMILMPFKDKKLTGEKIYMSHCS